MVALYAVAVLLGAVSLGSWILLGVMAERPGSSVVDPEARFGLRGRSTVAGVLGFGLGGMSASYAGWPELAALGAAAGGAVFAVLSGRYLGIGGDEA
jgi:hypothetical protein